MKKKALTWANRIVTGILIAVFVLVAALVVSSKFSGGEPNIFGYQVKTVLSGSMEPGIKTGSVIFVKPGGDMTRFKEGDVITFKDEEERLITHRITEVVNSGNEFLYRTKGDNNDAEDLNPVPSSNVVAEYTGVTIPFVGYIQDFANSKSGILFLVILPGILLLGYSVYSIWRTLSQLDKQYKKKLEEKNDTPEQTIEAAENATEPSVPK